ncbi:MAG: carbohydrate ABC transporter permease [Lachnospiraceae bacterium]|nr:carbohydrate ABC transporter permease [Lachnospiraceae bacterium]
MNQSGATVAPGRNFYKNQISKEELEALKLEMNKKALIKRRSQTIFRLAVNVLVAFVVLLPLLYAISIAFMPSGELFSLDLNLFPKNPTIQNFVSALKNVPLLQFILNSFLVAGLITLGQIITCSLSAFAFSFLEFKGKGILFMIVMATMMVPGEATIISNYLTVGNLGMLDTYSVLIIPYLTSAMGIFLFRQFYMTFPMSLYESAKLDGCSNLRFILKILIPLTKSAIGAMAVYTFINAWNMYMWPLLVTGSDKMRTVQIGISMLNSVDSQSITLMIAGVVIIIIPSISIFIVGQKQLIRGMFSGAVKG